MNIHFTPFFFILAGLTAIHNSFAWFLALHVLALSAAAVLVYDFGRTVTSSRSVAVVLYAIFVTNPYTSAVNLYPHYEAFGLVLLLGCGLAAYTRRYGIAALCLIIAMTVKQDFWFYALVATWIAIPFSRWRRALLLSLIPAAYFLIVIHGLYPCLYPHRTSNIHQVWNYAHSQGDIMRQLALHPVGSLLRAFRGPGLAFQGLLLFVPVLAPMRYLLALPTLVLWVNATDIDRRLLSYYYSIPILTLHMMILPFALVRCRTFARVVARRARWALDAHRSGAGTAAGGSPRHQFIEGIRARVARLDAAVFVAVCILAAVCMGHVRLSAPGLARCPSIRRVFRGAFGDRDRYLHGLMRRELDDRSLSVFAQFPLASYVPKRKEIYISHWAARPLYAGKIRPDLILLDTKRWDHLANPMAVNAFVSACGEYETVRAHDGIQLYRFRRADRDLRVAPDH